MSHYGGVRIRLHACFITAYDQVHQHQQGLVSESLSVVFCSDRESLSVVKVNDPDDHGFCKSFHSLPIFICWRKTSRAQMEVFTDSFILVYTMYFLRLK